MFFFFFEKIHFSLSLSIFLTLSLSLSFSASFSLFLSLSLILSPLVSVIRCVCITWFICRPGPSWAAGSCAWTTKPGCGGNTTCKDEISEMTNDDVTEVLMRSKDDVIVVCFKMGKDDVISADDVMMMTSSFVILTWMLLSGDCDAFP